MWPVGQAAQHLSDFRNLTPSSFPKPIQQSPRPLSAQPGGRRVFWAKALLLAPHRSTSGYARRSRLASAQNPLPRMYSYFRDTTLVVVLALSCLSFVGEGQEKAGDTKPKANEVRAKAEKGDAQAQFDLGWMYDEGKSVEQDSAEATKWYRKAAEQGLARAQLKLGSMYENRAGVH